MELNHLRKRKLGGSTPATTFFQLKKVFHLMESVGSARIEGNHTTIAEYVEQKIEHGQHSEERYSEIANVEEAMTYIEDNISKGTAISHRFIRELHQIVVTDLDNEGDGTPGAYRTSNVSIASSDHLPPDLSLVQGLMDELLEFINKPTDDKYDLLKIAVAHHRFTWIHPFGNGNGRVVRLLTYCMMIKCGFNVKQGQIINPTAVFCNDRNVYYEMLSKADTGTDEGILQWCAYVTDGILEEITKVDKLLDYRYLHPNILVPTLDDALERQYITHSEHKILMVGIHPKQPTFVAKDIAKVLPETTSRQRTHMISKLKESDFIRSPKDNPRTYYVSFINNTLMRSLITRLEKEAFIPKIDS